jgi:hypothetical protein
MMQYRYGDGWEQFPIEPGEVWGLPDGSRVAVHDIFNPLPEFMFKADLLFVDPPWNQGNLTAFYTKADRKDYKDFNAFTAILFERIGEIVPQVCYIEIGNQFVDAWLKRLGGLYPYTQRWPVVYYRKYSTNIIRGSRCGLLDHDYSGMDEAQVIAESAKREVYTVMGDPCMGQGLVGLAAFAAGKPFVGTELNKRRLANLLKKIAKQGGIVEKIS